MATFKFSIVKIVNDDEIVEAVPGYSEEQFLLRMQSKIKEKFLLKVSRFKMRFSIDECLNAVEESFNESIADLKEETVKMKA